MILPIYTHRGMFNMFWNEEHSFQCCFVTHAAQSRNEVTVRRLKDSSSPVKVLKASLGGNRPIRVSPELEDDVDGFPLKDERVKGRTAEEGLRLQTLHVPESSFRVFAQKLQRPGGVRVNTRHANDHRFYMT